MSSYFAILQGSLSLSFHHIEFIWLHRITFFLINRASLHKGIPQRNLIHKYLTSRSQSSIKINLKNLNIFKFLHDQNIMQILDILIKNFILISLYILYRYGGANKY